MAKRAPYSNEADYVVVGSGSSGAVVAGRLAQSGASVILLEAGPSDDDALVRLFPLADKDLLAQIRNPKLPQDYFATIQHALANAFLYEDVVVSWCGRVAQPDIIAEMADFFIRFDQVNWALAVGHFDGLLKLSIRAGLLGEPVRRLRLELLIAASLAVGLAVATAGAVGFVGLVVPQAWRLAGVQQTRELAGLSAMGGATLLVGADLVARTVAAPMELPAGAVMALLGAPCFIALLVRGTR